MLGRRGPGLVRVAATTAVVAGTAGAVRNRQDQKYAAKDQAAYDQQMAQQAAAQQAAAAAAPAAPAQPEYMAELEQLAQLKAQGIISEEEFEAKKKQLLGL
jgi:predicted Zn-dependent peptidase